jgi:SagB-type dehydrogenase family enzyme
MRRHVLLFIAILCLLVGSSKEVAMAKAKDIQLAQPKTKSEVSLEEAIAKRRSVRNFVAKDLSEEQISQLLWAGQGITAKTGGHNLRTAPSAGALYPIELYLLSKDGLFRYLPEGHKLEALSDKDLRRDLSAAALGQASVRDAAVDIVICGVPSRITGKYGERGIRYMHIEAGHIAQNIHLQAVALGLGSLPVGAFNDKEADKILGLSADCHTLYIIPVGYAEK